MVYVADMTRDNVRFDRETRCLLHTIAVMASVKRSADMAVERSLADNVRSASMLYGAMGR